MNQTNIPLRFHSCCHPKTGELFGQVYEVPEFTTVIIEQAVQHGEKLLVRCVWPVCWAWVSPDQITEPEAA
jgi:hypothetical protein